MRRATTPTVEIHIDACLTDCWYRVIFKQRNGVKLIKSQDDENVTLSEDGKTINVRLEQAETLLFSDKYDLRVQVKFGLNGNVSATNVAVMGVDEILDEEVI